MWIKVEMHQRAFVIRDGKPVRYLGPGRHWHWSPFHKIEVIRTAGWSGATANLVADLDADQLALVPDGDVTQLELEPHQRAVVYARGRPKLWLQAGSHQIWTVDQTLGKDRKPVSAIRAEVFDTSGVAAQPLRDEVKALAPAGDYTEATAPEGSVAVRYVDGVLDAVLPTGRHAAWTTMRKVQLSVIDLRERLLHVTGQDIMSKDRVTLRLNLSAAFRVKDAKRLATVARVPDDVMYLAMQLAAREATAARTLDELLSDRAALAEQMGADVRARAESVGLELVSFGIKDLILPGEMKTLLNRVIEAQKEAEANVILRREETAATRSLAQTAKVLSENPLLVRLKELEAYKELAGKVGQVHLVLGEGAMPMLQLKSS
jgi:regulator of protease activity HflC (stomatin/prohibitin superfamily)